VEEGGLGVVHLETHHEIVGLPDEEDHQEDLGEEEEEEGEVVLTALISPTGSQGKDKEQKVLRVKENAESGMNVIELSPIDLASISQTIVTLIDGIPISKEIVPTTAVITESQATVMTVEQTLSSASDLTGTR